MFKKLSYIIFIFVIGFLALEAGTRLLGQKGGFIENFKSFQLVEELEIYNLYQLDNYGIYSINSPLFDSLKAFPVDEYPSFVYQENVVEVLDDFKKLQTTITTDSSAFAKMIVSNTDSSFSYLLEKYLRSPINEDGFKSIPFENTATKRKKILLLGDSFAYGLSASPSYYSFADELLAKGYVVYNSGINGTDPAQYAAVLEKYLTQLQPDIVILNFSSASDFMPFQREAKAGQAHEHQTNAGFIESAPLGQYLDASDAYTFYKNFVSVPQNSLAYKLCKNSTAASFLYRLTVKTGLITHEQQQAYYNLRKTITDEQKATNTKLHIDKMNALALKNGIPFLNVVIPVKPESKHSDKNYNAFFVDESALNISFENWEYQYPKNLQLEDYEEYGVHFNNSGSKKYADYLDQLIQKVIND